MATELSQYKTYEDGEEYFGNFATDEKILDIICVQPLVIPEWVKLKFTLFKIDGTIFKTIEQTENFKTIIVEKGFIVDFEAIWKWKQKEGYANPDKTSITYKTDTVLNDSNVESKPLLFRNLNNTITIKRFLEKNINTPIVDITNRLLLKPIKNSKIQTQVSISIYFYGKTFVGKVNKPQIESFDDIQRINSSTIDRGLQPNRIMNLNNVSVEDGEYFCYLFPKDYGKLQTIIQDGSTPILDSFSIYEISRINDAGLNVPYYVYITKNSGAFKSAKLEFK